MSSGHKSSSFLLAYFEYQQRISPLKMLQFSCRMGSMHVIPAMP